MRLYKIYGDYKEATTALLRDGGVFGKLSLVEGRWQDVFAEAVSKVMSELQCEGSIEIQKPQYSPRNKAALAERASGPSGLSIDGQLPV